MPFFIKFNLALACLVLGYWLIFQQKSAFRINRFLLLSFLPIAAIIPSLNTGWKAPGSQVNISGSFPNFFPTTTPTTDRMPLQTTAVEEVSTFSVSFTDLLLVIYLMELSFFLIQILKHSISLWKFIKSEHPVKYADHWRITSRKIQAPFSFFWYMVLPNTINDPQLHQQIVSHEAIHIKEWHSIDILLVNLCTAICWFNPFAWKLRQFIRQNHEYLVDETLLRRGIPPKTYQLSLLQSQFGSLPSILSHAYNLSFIKKRIQMMQTKANPVSMKLRYLVFSLSLLPIIFLFTSVKDQNPNHKLPGVEKGGILTLFTRSTTDLELETAAQAFLARGYNFEILERNRTVDGLLDDIEIKISAPKKSSGTTDFHQLSQQGVPAKEILGILWYSNDGGSASVGIVQPEKIQDALLYKDKIEWHLLGFSSSLDKLPNYLQKGTKARQKRKENLIKENNYKIPNHGSWAITFRDFQQESSFEHFLNEVKKDEENYHKKANFFLDGVPSNLEEIKQKAGKRVKVEGKFESQTIYNKKFEIIDQICTQLDIRVTNLPTDD